MKIIDQFNDKYQPLVDRVALWPEKIFAKSRIQKVATAGAEKFMNFYLNLKPMESNLFETSIKKRFNYHSTTLVPNVVMSLVALSLFSLAIFINFSK